jgi:hypothetical protein
MVSHIQCKDCKNFYKYFKQTKDEKGMLDFTSIPKCRLGYEISSEGYPVNTTCFEAKN